MNFPKGKSRSPVSPKLDSRQDEFLFNSPRSPWVHLMTYRPSPSTALCVASVLR